jgi:RNA polymerase sigma-70 factor (ECF subfamily)
MAPNLNDIKLKIASDEYAAFRELYLLMYAPMMRFAAIYTHSPQAAEDVLADVFLKLWDQRSQLHRIDNLRVYLYTAIKNTALNYRNRQAKITARADDLSELETGQPDPEHALIAAEMSEHIQKAVNQLPPRCKLIFQLAKEEGLRYKEISSILGISVKTIDNQLAIALSKIAGTILEYEKKYPG